MTNIVIVKQSSKKYLFSVPMGTTLKKYDKVVCDTARGEQEGICFTNSFIVESDALSQIALLTGATLPLKSVIGKSEVVRFKDKPQESKFKVGERYKVSDYIFREGGNIIEITDKQGSRYYYKTISGTHTPDISTAFSEVSAFAECLTPYTAEKTVKEVKRTAKVGEYVKITGESYSDIDNGDICEVIANNKNNGVYVRSKKATSYKGNQSDRPIEQPFYYALDKEYVVLENYVPPVIEEEKAQDKQPKSEYYNGIVVCVDDTDTGFFTKGKVYTFKDGVIIDDQFSPYNDNDPIKKFSDTKDWQPKFSEYKVVKTADVKEPEKHTYKKGDYVRIISTNAINDFEVGYVVKLNYKVNPRPDERYWNCTWTGFNNGLTSYACEDEFEPFEYKEEIK